MLAVAGSDGTLRLLSSQSGKTVHELRCASSQAAGPARSDAATISCLGWGTHFRDGKFTFRMILFRDTNPRNHLSTAGLPLTSLSHLKAELPRDLALLDVERSLPKLSVLPPTGDKYVVMILRCLWHSG
jgi:anaphase-promoting complex subunit 4